MNIREEIHALSDEMLEKLERLVVIPSIEGEPLEGKPFGEAPAKALEEGLKIAEELGFKTVNLDNYCGYAEMGEGEEIIGIAAHLDVVPEGDGWTHEPFALTRDGDYVYGRGTTDDKGPIVEGLYAMKMLRDSGVKLNKRVRLIMGCNEENGSECMKHYNKVAEELSYGFTPDADFPCIHGEMGQMALNAYSKHTKIISMNGGFVFNAVCDTCTTVVPAEEGLKERLEKAFSESGLPEYKVTEENGELHIYAKGVPAHEFGVLTLCNGTVRTENGTIICTIDVRVPVTLHPEDVRKMCEGKLEDENGRMEIEKLGEPLFYPRESPLVEAIYRSYVDVTGDTKNQPIVIGGGTYAKYLKNVIAFGPEKTEIDYRIHGADEFIRISDMEEAVLMYMEALKNLLAI